MDGILASRLQNRLYSRDPLAPEEAPGSRKRKLQGLTGGRGLAPAAEPAPIPEEGPGLLRKTVNTGLGGLAMVGNLLDIPGSMARDLTTWIPGGIKAQNPLDQLLRPLSGENRVSGEDMLAKNGLLDEKRPDGFFANVPRFAAGIGTEIILDPLTYVGVGLVGKAAGGLSKGGKAAARAGLADKSLDIAKDAAKAAGKDPDKVGWRLARQQVTGNDIIAKGDETFDSVNRYKQRLEAAGATDDTLKEPIGGLATFGLPFRDKTVWSGGITDPLGGKTRGMVRDVLGSVPGGGKVIDAFRSATSAAGKVPGQVVSGQEVASLLDRGGEAVRFSAPGRGAAKLFTRGARNTTGKEGQLAGQDLTNREPAASFEARHDAYPVVREFDNFGALRNKDVVDETGQVIKSGREIDFEHSNAMMDYIEAGVPLPENLMPLKGALDEYKHLQEGYIDTLIESGSGIQRVGMAAQGKIAKQLSKSNTKTDKIQKSLDELDAKAEANEWDPARLRDNRNRLQKKLAAEGKNAAEIQKELDDLITKQPEYMTRVRVDESGSPLHSGRQGRSLQVDDPNAIARDPHLAVHRTSTIQRMSVDPEFAGKYDPKKFDPHLAKKDPARPGFFEAFKVKYADELDDDPAIQARMFDWVTTLNRTQAEKGVPAFSMNPIEGLIRRGENAMKTSQALRTATDFISKNASRIDPGTAPVIGRVPMGGPSPTPMRSVDGPPIETVVPPAADVAEAMRANRVKAEGAVRTNGRGGLAEDFEPYRQFDEVMRDISDAANNRWTFHGIRDTVGNPPEASLDSLLTKGVDNAKPFFTGPARVVSGIAGAGLNTKTNAPYLLMFDGAEKAKSGIPDYVVVNDEALVNLQSLQSKYPGVKFINPEQAKQVAESAPTSAPAPKRRSIRAIADELNGITPNQAALPPSASLPPSSVPEAVPVPGPAMAPPVDVPPPAAMPAPGSNLAPLDDATETNLYTAISQVKEGSNDNYMGVVVKKLGALAEQIKADIKAANPDPEYVPTNKEILESMKVPREIAEDFTRLISKPANDLPEAMLSRLYDSYLNVTKTNLTATNINFHTRNRGGGRVNNLLHGVKDPTVKGPFRAITQYLQPDRDWKVLEKGGTVERANEIPALRDRWATAERKRMEAEGIASPVVDYSKYTDEVASEQLRNSVFATGLLDSPGQANDLIGTTGSKVASQIPGRDALLEAQRDPATLGRFEKYLTPAQRATMNKIRPEKGSRWRDILNPLATKGGMGDSDKFIGARAGRVVGDVVEGRNRGAVFIGALREGYDEVEALKRANEIHLDYGDLSEFERRVARRVVPFYSYNRKMVPQVFNELTSRPGGPLAQTIRGTNSLNDPNEVTPEYIKDTISLPLGKSLDGGRRYLTGLGLMHEGPLSLLSTDPSELARKFMSQTAPFVKALPELGSNEVFFQGSADGGRSLDDIDPPLGRLAANLTGSETPYNFGKLTEYAIGNSPLSRYVTQARQLTDKRKPWVDKGINFLTGARIATVSPATEDGVLRADAEATLKSLGSRNHITPYVPKELQATFTPEQQAQFDDARARLNLINSRSKERASEKRLAEANELILRGNG